MLVFSNNDRWEMKQKDELYFLIPVTGTTLPVRLRRRPQVRALFVPSLDAGQALQRLLRALPRRGRPKPGGSARHRAGVPQQALRGHFRVLRLAPKLLLQTVLLSLPGPRLLL